MRQAASPAQPADAAGKPALSPLQERGFASSWRAPNPDTHVCMTGTDMHACVSEECLYRHGCKVGCFGLSKLFFGGNSFPCITKIMHEWFGAILQVAIATNSVIGFFALLQLSFSHSLFLVSSSFFGETFPSRPVLFLLIFQLEAVASFPLLIVVSLFSCVSLSLSLSFSR